MLIPHTHNNNPNCSPKYIPKSLFLPMAPIATPPLLQMFIPVSASWDLMSCYTWAGAGGVWRNTVHVWLCSKNFSCTCTPARCYVAATYLVLAHLLDAYDVTTPLSLAYQLDASLQELLLRLHRLNTYILDATLQELLLHLHTDVLLRCNNISCTCTPTCCYVVTTSLALAYRLDAMLQELLLHLHTG